MKKKNNTKTLLDSLISLNKVRDNLIAQGKSAEKQTKRIEEIENLIINNEDN